jgi:threonine dehydratase
VFLKGKHLQPTGSFKLRGVSNKLRLLERAERAAGVVTASTGNHGLAAARAGSLLGVSVMVYVAASASPLKIAAIRAFGAELVLVEGPTIAAERQARESSSEEDAMLGVGRSPPDQAAERRGRARLSARLTRSAGRPCNAVRDAVER